MTYKKLKFIAIALSVCLALSLTGMAYLAFIVVDNALTKSYSDDSARLTEETLRHASSLLASTWSGMPSEKLLSVLKTEAKKKDKEQILIKEDKTEGVIWFDNLQFIIRDGRLHTIVI